MRSRDARDQALFVPFLLLPSTFPRIEFEKVVRIHVPLQKLVHFVAHDEAFLRKTLAK